MAWASLLTFTILGSVFNTLCVSTTYLSQSTSNMNQTGIYSP
jgi:hypothetical protein